MGPNNSTVHHVAHDRHIVVLGAGVVGLTCAIRLAQSGYEVVIWTKEKGPGLASDQCGGLWEPFHIEPAELVRPWCADTYHQLKIDAETPAKTGVREWKSFQIFGPGQEATRDNMPWWGEDVGMEVCILFFDCSIELMRESRHVTAHRQ